ncbi:hypothetical protein PVAND_004836 [Polypedilum vanderplanki]|uniref:Uncharacterized protein n=1 Tax=Polypedilum vanderplanki TaxID=319348 RepID=A0A9J6BZ99_POLVA|nr:hypothetical protein PVAND_004836 [Polypedilum vanderplanki]
MGWIFQKVLSFVLLVIFIEISFACQGYKLKINYIKACGNNNVIKISENMTAKLTKDCEIIPIGCAETDGFKTAMVHYEIFKNNLPVLRGDMDACAQVEKAKPEIKEIIKMFGLPDKCPIDKYTKCEDGSKNANLEKFKSLIPLARGGPIRSEITVQHDTGKSCFKSEIELIKKA